MDDINEDKLIERLGRESELVDSFYTGFKEYTKFYSIQYFGENITIEKIIEFVRDNN